MTRLPSGEDRPAYLVEEPASDYLRLLAAARQAAARIVETPAEELTGAASYIRRASQELVSALPDGGHDVLAADGAIAECLRRLVRVWPDVAGGRVDGERVVAEDPGLWKRAMTEWPMGGFARMTAQVLIDRDLLRGKVVELGAGVGSCSALVAAHVTDEFIRTDRQPALLRRQRIPGAVARYDFDEPGPWHDRDTVFAANALHCARDKTVTCEHLFRMLRPGGTLVLGEGLPHTDERRTPWALNPFFGLFRGWWDVGGFVRREDWFVALGRAGFRALGFAARRSGAHDLGGVIWAVK